MILSWADNAWDDSLYWQRTDKKTLKRTNTLVKDIAREPFSGLGDPEPLKHNWSGCWSRRIDESIDLFTKSSMTQLLLFSVDTTISRRQKLECQYI